MMLWYDRYDSDAELNNRLVLDFFRFFWLAGWDTRCDILCLFPDVRKAACQNSARSKKGLTMLDE